MADADDPALTEAFWAVAGQLRRMSIAALSEWAVSPSHSRALSVLGRHGTMRLSELSEHLHIAARSATEVVDALEDRGLARRLPDPHDRRATLVELTEDGQAVEKRVKQSRAAEAEAYFGRLSERDRRTLTRILRTLLEDQPVDVPDKPVPDRLQLP